MQFYGRECADYGMPRSETLTSIQKACLQSKTAAELSKAYTADTFLYDGVGYYGPLGVTGPITHAFYPYADGNVIPEDPYTSGVKVPAVFGYSMCITIRVLPF
jgi:hypothetical protein